MKIKNILKKIQANTLLNKIQKNGYSPHQDWVAYEPQLVPPLELMRSEGVQCLEEWYRWAEEWSMLLRVYGRITTSSKVLEIGCGLGRIAFPLRYILISDGSYDGFEICRFKVNFLEQSFNRAYPNFRFIWANIHNTAYNPDGQIEGKDYRFLYADNSFDIVYAASVFTHMLPDTTEHYFQETFRVLKPGGRVVFSFFLLDNYRPKQARPLGFARPIFNFDYSYGQYGNEFALVSPDNPEYMTAYRLSLIEQFADKAGLEIQQSPLPGFWSGTHSNWVGLQDLVIFQKRVL
jgi:SAM-dependent methyltransferase